MKTNTRAWRAAVVLALSGSTFLCAEDYIYSGFDLDTEGWVRGWGINDFALEWDGTVDSKNNAASGSLKITANFTASTSWQDLVLQRISDFDFTSYSKIAYDVKADTNQPASTDGDYNTTQISLRTPGWAWTGWHTSKQVTADGWVHVEEIVPSAFNAIIALNIAFGGSDFNGPVTYWLDNVRFVSETVGPAPTIQMSAVRPGLEIIGTGGQYQRQSVRTTEPKYSWVNSAGAVDYSMDIVQAPPAGSPDLFAYLWLIGTETTDPGTSPDWNEPNGIFLEIRQAANGSYSVLLSHKTEAAGAHGTRFEAAGVLARMENVPSVTGRWTVSMKGAEATLIAPDGSRITGLLPADKLAGFANVFPHFGVQMDNTIARNQAFTFGRFAIQGTNPDFNSNLSQDLTAIESLNTEVWRNVAQDTSGVQPVPTGTLYKISWDAPATGYSLRSKSSLTGAWIDPALPVFSVGGRKVTHVRTSNLPSADAGFFAVQKQ
jgi:hypothetical protein